MNLVIDGRGHDGGHHGGHHGGDDGGHDGGGHDVGGGCQAMMVIRIMQIFVTSAHKGISSTVMLELQITLCVNIF